MGATDSSTSRTRRERRTGMLRQRYGLLLGSLVVLFLVQGLAPSGAWAEVLVTALSAGALILALSAGEVTPRIATLVAALAAVIVVVQAALAATGTNHTGAARLATGVLVGAAPPAIVVGVLRGVREQGSATVQAVLGVLSLYLMIGMFCAAVYGAIDRLGGAPFFANGATATTSHCLYFSFATLTTVGYGDFTARSDLGHTLAVMEALVGQIYLVTVVAVLVSNLGSRRDRER